MMENGDTRDDLTLPGGTDEYDRLAKQIKEDFEEGKELIVTVLKVRDQCCMRKAARGGVGSEGCVGHSLTTASPRSLLQAMKTEMISSVKVVLPGAK